MGIAVIGLAIGAVGTVASVVTQNKAARASERAAEASRKQQAVQARSARRQAIRQGMQARSQAVASAQGSGASESSGAIGGIGAIGSQLGSSIGTQGQLTALSQIISFQQSRAASLSARANMFSSIGGLGFSLSSAFGGVRTGGSNPNAAPIPDLTQPQF